jgi:hypothetical protein
MAYDYDGLRERLGLLPQAERRHFVFLHRCGCLFGLTEYRHGVTTEDEAWDDMYETAAEGRAATLRGVRVVHVDHATYSREFYPLMLTPCTHTAEAVA